MLKNADDFSGDNGGSYGKSWNIGEDYLRIDGSVCGKTREDSCRKFNDLSNTKYFNYNYYQILSVIANSLDLTFTINKSDVEFFARFALFESFSKFSIRFQ